jgi:hypothetical protein
MRTGIPAPRIVVGRPVLAILNVVVHGPIPFVAIRTAGPSPLAPGRLVVPGPVVHHEPVRRRPLIVLLRRAMPAATILAVRVRRAVPAASGLVVPVDTLLGVAIPGVVPTAGTTLVAGLVDTRDVHQRGRIRRPLNRYEEPTDDRPVRPRPALPPVDGRRDLLGEGPVPRRGTSLRGNGARRRGGYGRAVTRCGTAVLWPRAAGVLCDHACRGLRLGGPRWHSLRWHGLRRSDRRRSGRNG